jgi:hypothetical protein
MIFPIGLFAQNIVIHGNVLDYDTNKPLEGITVILNKDNGTLTDKNGKFQFTVQNITSRDKLRIGFINYFELIFTNLPNKNDTIEFKNVPLFYYFPDELDPISIFCRRFDLVCKWNRHKRMNEEDKRLEPYYKERNRIIESYKYIFCDKVHYINVSKHKIDLKSIN